MSEHDEQCNVVAWFKMQYPKYKDCIIAIPNGAHLAGSRVQRAKKMNRMKKEGLKPGCSDLFIAVPAGGKCGLWIEMKDHDKTKSAVKQNQWDHTNLMIKMGYAATWCAGFETAKIVIEKYMGQPGYYVAGVTVDTY